jgi:hypothetical protein
VTKGALGTLGTVYFLKSTVNRPKNIVNRPKNTVYFPKNMVNRPKNTVNFPKSMVNRPKNTVNRLKNTVYFPKSTVNRLKNTVNFPKNMVNHPKNTVNRLKNTVYFPKSTVNRPKNMVNFLKNQEPKIFCPYSRTLFCSQSPSSLFCPLNRKSVCCLRLLWLSLVRLAIFEEMWYSKVVFQFLPKESKEQKQWNRYFPNHKTIRKITGFNPLCSATGSNIGGFWRRNGALLNVVGGEPTILLAGQRINGGGLECRLLRLCSAEPAPEKARS